MPFTFTGYPDSGLAGREFGHGQGFGGRRRARRHHRPEQVRQAPGGRRGLRLLQQFQDGLLPGLHLVEFSRVAAIGF